jgi:putative heme-binding domain-containing protein
VEDVTVVFTASVPFTMTQWREKVDAWSSGQTGGSEDGHFAAKSRATAGGRHEIVLKHSAKESTWLPVEFDLPTGPAAPELTVTWSTADDARARAFPLRRFLLPWAKPEGTPAATGERKIPEIAGGNWLHGRRLFFGSKVACSKCHAIRGEGGHVGPDLSNLLFRDYASVVKDVRLPNATLNPDHIASVVELADAEDVIGLITSESDTEVVVTDASAQPKKLRRAEVKSIRPATLSLMPEGLWDVLNAEEQRDLMTFLLTVPLEPATVQPTLQGQSAPAPRKRAEFESLLSSASTVATSAPAPFRIVLCAAAKDPGHGGAGYHDYPLWRERWAKLLALADGVTVETADRWPSPEQFHKADVIAFYHDNPAWTAERAKDLDSLLARGGGLVFLHWSMNGRSDAKPLAARLAMAWRNGSKFRYGPEPLQIHPHALAAGFGALNIVDESYWNLAGDLKGTDLLATTIEEGRPQPQIWTRTQGDGRVFVCIPGHFTWTFDDPVYRILLLRGLCWAGHQPLDRLAELASVGARLADE